MSVRDWLQQYRYAKKHGILNPWPVIVWRAVWSIPYHAVLVLLCLIAAAGWGGAKAYEIWITLRIWT